MPSDDSAPTTYNLSECIHDEYGLTTGVLYDQFVDHLWKNQKKFISVTFKNKAGDRYYEIENSGVRSEDKAMGLNIAFLSHLMHNEKWCPEFYTAHLVYKTRSGDLKNTVLSIQQPEALSDIEDINKNINEIVIENK
jgi:hypothetical protein